MAILIFLLILSILVVVHEFGHFFAAKFFGVRVEEFGMGLPPRVWGKKVGETLYSINALPLGGFVKLYGEDETDQDISEDSAVEHSEKSFVTKTNFQKSVILLAGVIMNVLLAVLVFYGVFLARDFKTQTFPLFFEHRFAFGDVTEYHTVVLDTEDGFPADQAGILPGELIIAVNEAPVGSIDEIRALVEASSGSSVLVTLADISTVSSTPDTRTVELIPEHDEEGSLALGVYLGDAVSIDYGGSLASKLSSGFTHSYNVFVYTLKTLGKIVSVSFQNRDIAPVSSAVAGPVGTFFVVDTIVKSAGAEVVLTLLDFTAIMSLSLAFVNLMPFPALDGGRFVFVLFNQITGHRVKPSTEAFVHKLGIAFLLFLSFAITVKDIFQR